MKKPALDVTKYPTGLDDKVNRFENTVLLQLGQRGKPQIFGIVGLGGVGKTTLAKEIFNRKNSDYSMSCFLSDVRDNAGKGHLLSLQRKLLRSLNVSDMAIERVDSVDEGKAMLKMHLSSVKALVTLDDVDDVDQVDALLPVQTVFPSDSMILVTSRNRDVLISSKIEESSIYNLTGLDIQQSRELFCLHAFNQPDPLPEFESLVVKFLETCNGLPLSLKVIGALLYGKKLCDWEAELKSLQKILPTKIHQSLKRSYLSLNTEEQNIFLDVACFFRGQNKDRAINIWDGSGWQGRRGFQNLLNRCLVEVDSRNNIQVHDHLRDMGRDIAKDPELPCRLWRWTEDTIDDLLQRPPGRAVRGIVGISAYHYIDVDDALGDIRMKRLQLLDTEGALVEHILAKVQYPNLKWLRWDNCPHFSLPSSISMKNLRVLQVGGPKLETLWENESQVPLQLRDLEIEAPLSNIPKSIGQLKHLERIFVGSFVRESYARPLITELPEEFCFLQSLKVLVLTACPEMRSLPQCFGNLTNLQYIQLDGCYVLERLPESFGNLSNLHHIDLSGCTALERLPESFGNLTNLHHIDLSSCHVLESLPDSFGKLIKLQYLDLGCCNNLAMSSETLGTINTIEYINLNGCQKIEILPPQLVYQRSLEKLCFTERNVKEVPSAIGEIRYLEVVELGGPLLDMLPASLGNLRNLMKLRIWNCKALKCLPASLGLLTQLTELSVCECPLISELPFKQVEGERKTLNDLCTFPRLKILYLHVVGISEVSFPEGVCCNLENLNIYHCVNLIEIGTLPSRLRGLYCSECHNLRKMDALYGLEELECLYLAKSMELEELPHMGTLVSLTRITIVDCANLKGIWGLGELTKLREFMLKNCPELEELEGLQDCMSLQHLIVEKCLNSRLSVKS